MAAAEQRKLLEQLMGSDPPVNTSAKKSQAGGPRRSGAMPQTMYDPKICRSYLVGTCPHELFINTKFDLGQCPKQHSDRFKADYEKAKREGTDIGFEWDYLRDLQKYVDDCNRKIEAAQRRLDKTPEEIIKTQQLIAEMAELEKKIDLSLDEIEILGSLGAIARSLDEYHTVMNLKIDRAERERELKALTEVAGISGHQKLQVCDVCGAYLSRLDNDRRLADHFGGKMHLGFSRMRTELRQLQKDLAGKTPSNNQERRGGRGGGKDEQGRRYDRGGGSAWRPGRNGKY